MWTTTIPALAFGFIIALLCGALYHFIRNGGGWQLLLYLFLSVSGFAAGQALHWWRGWILLPFGMLDIGFGALGSFVFLVLGDWLSRIEISDQSGV